MNRASVLRNMMWMPADETCRALTKCHSCSSHTVLSHASFRGRRVRWKMIQHRPNVNTVHCHVVLQSVSIKLLSITNTRHSRRSWILSRSNRCYVCACQFFVATTLLAAHNCPHCLSCAGQRCSPKVLHGGLPKIIGHIQRNPYLHRRLQARKIL